MQPEIIKKTINLKTKTEIVSENEIQVIPDTGVTYSMKFSLKKREIDLGFFDVVEQSPALPITTTPPITTSPPTTTPPITTAAPTTAAPTTAPPSTRPPLEPVDPCFGTDDVNNISLLGLGGGGLIGINPSAVITINNNVAFDFDNETITSANVIVNVPNAPNVSGFSVQSTPFIGISVDFDGQLVSGSYQFIFNTTTNCVATINAIYNDQTEQWTVN